MKILSIFAIVCLMFTPAGLAQDEATVKAMYTEGQRAYAAGDLDTAKQKFETVLEIDGKHAGAMSYMRNINARQAKGGGSAGHQQFSQVVLPQVKFRDATLDSALDYLKQTTEQQLGGDVPVNFVTQVPRETLSQKVTLDLRNVPFMDVLRYLGDMAGVTFKVDQYAIVMRPKEPAGTE